MANKVDEELYMLATEFFGFHPGKLYQEIYAVGYNEFIEAVKTLKEALHKKFPNKTDEIDTSCDAFLSEYFETFDKKWFKKFSDFCSKNTFKIPEHIPVYDPELDERVANKEAPVRLRLLKNKVLSMEYFNSQLVQKIKEVDDLIKERESLRDRIERMKIKVEVIKKGREMELELRSISGELVHNSSYQTETET